MAIIYLDSFEHRVLEIGVNASGASSTWYFVTDSAAIPNHGGNFITFDSSVIRPDTDHTCSLKMAPVVGEAAQIRKTISEGEGVASFYFKADANPTAAVTLFAFGATSNGILNLMTDGSLQLRIGAGVQSTLVGPFTDGEWHKADVLYDVNQNPWTLDAQVDGAAFTQRTTALAASTITDWNIGVTQTTQEGVYWETDLVIANTAAEYPIADHECKKREIVGKGTHNLGSGAFQDEGGSTTDDFEVSVDDAWDGTTPNLTQTGEDYVQQTANDGAAYVEFTVDTTTDTEIWAVLLGTLMAAENSATAMNCETQLVHSGTTYATTGLVDPSSNAGYYNGYRMIETASPGADGWTDTEFNDIVIRFGFSTDAAPDAAFNSAIVEYVTPWSAAAPASLVTPSRSRNNVLLRR